MKGTGDGNVLVAPMIPKAARLQVLQMKRMDERHRED